MEFISTKRAYQRWLLAGRTEIVFAVITLLAASLALLWPAIIAGVSWAYLEGRRRLYRSLFWHDALDMYSFSGIGEPEIYEFMRKRHRQEHARRVFNRRMMESEDHDGD